MNYEKNKTLKKENDLLIKNWKYTKKTSKIITNLIKKLMIN